MRNDDSGPVFRFSSACIFLSCSRDFSTDPRKRSTSLRTWSGRILELNEMKSGSKARTAFPMAVPTEATTPCMMRSEPFILFNHPARYWQTLSKAWSSSAPLARTPTFVP